MPMQTEVWRFIVNRILLLPDWDLERWPTVWVQVEDKLSYICSLHDTVSHVNNSLMTSANVYDEQTPLCHFTHRLVVIHHTSTTSEKFEKCKQSRIRSRYPEHRHHTQTYLHRITRFPPTSCCGCQLINEPWDNLTVNSLPTAVALVPSVEISQIQNNTLIHRTIKLENRSIRYIYLSDVRRYTVCHFVTVDSKLRCVKGYRSTPPTEHVYI
jgi:hypothetical protein